MPPQGQCGELLLLGVSTAILLHSAATWCLDLMQSREASDSDGWTSLESTVNARRLHWRLTCKCSRRHPSAPIRSRQCLDYHMAAVCLWRAGALYLLMLSARACIWCSRASGSGKVIITSNIRS